MLKTNKQKTLLSALCIFSCCTLLSCVKKVSDKPLWGLIEGVYYYESQEGVIPQGWSFSIDSRFEFVENGPEEDLTKPLENGAWQMPKYILQDDGTKFQKDNCKMVWSNTPFDTMSPLKPAGVYREDDNTAMYPMTEFFYSSPWHKGIGAIHCGIAPVTRNDYSRRRLSIHFFAKNETRDRFTVNFSM